MLITAYFNEDLLTIEKTVKRIESRFMGEFNIYSDRENNEDVCTAVCGSQYDVMVFIGALAQYGHTGLLRVVQIPNEDGDDHVAD